MCARQGIHVVIEMEYCGQESRDVVTAQKQSRLSEQDLVPRFWVLISEMVTVLMSQQTWEMLPQWLVGYNIVNGW